MISNAFDKLNFLSYLKQRLCESSTTYRFVEGAFWTLVGALVVRALGGVSGIIVARLLGKELFGELGMVQSTIGFFGIFAGLGMAGAATKYIAELRNSAPWRVGRVLNLAIVLSLVTGLVVTMVFVLLTPWLASTTLNRPDLLGLLIGGGLLMFLSTISSVPAGALAAFEAFKKSAFNNTLVGIFTPLVIIPAVWVFSAHGAIAAYSILAALGVILGAVTIDREIKKRSVVMKVDSSIWKELPIVWKYAIPSTLSGLVPFFTIWISNTILVNQVNGYGDLGLFNAANQWCLMIIFLPSHLTLPALSISSDMFGKNDLSGYTRTSLLNLQITWKVALPITVALICFAPAISSLYGRDFLGVPRIMYLLTVSYFLSIVSSAMGTALASAGRMWFVSIANIGWGIILLIVGFALIPKLGGIGLAVAYLSAYVVQSVFFICYLEFKLIPNLVRSQRLLMVFSVIIVGLGVVVGFKNLNTITGSFLLVFVSLLPLIWTLRSALQRLFSIEPSNVLRFKKDGEGEVSPVETSN